MKLINRNPRDYIGRTILFRGQAWQVVDVDGEHVKLLKPGLNQNGSLLLHLFAQCTLFPDAAEIRVRFPKLIRALRDVCILTAGEAENALIGMIVNGPFFKGSEVLAHIGGAGSAIDRCWRFRHHVRVAAARSAALTAA